MDTPSLSYLLANPTALGVAFLRPALLLLLAAVPAFFLWPARLGTPRAHRAAALLRAGAFACVVLALAGTRLTARIPSDHLTLVAAVDVSDSIAPAGREWARRYLNELRRHLAPGDQLAVLRFAGDVELLRPLEGTDAVDALGDSATRAATDVSAAIASAMTLLPADGPRRVLLLTDGNETRGDARRQIPWLRAAGVRVDAVVPPQRSEPDVRIEHVIAPALVAEDSLVPVRVIAQNPGGLRPAVLNLYLDGEIADSAAVELQPGRNALALPTQLRGEGSHRLRAELAVEDDATAANNAREIGISISPRARLLLISTREQSPLARALRRKGFTVDVRPARALRGLEALLPYNAVVLEDATAGGLPKPALDHIERFVREHGGGLIVAGGAATYGDAGFAVTALKRLLPVTLEPHRPRPGAREPLALFLVLDRSNSMGYNSRIGTQRDGEKLRYAKEAALAVIGQLKDQDLVGVVAFDSQPHEIAPLRPLKENRRPLEDLIPRLVENGGTDFLDALGAARDQLSASRVDRRHIMLITDGDTNRAAPDEYRALIADLVADKISVTTVRIGDNTVNLKLLRDISAQTGGEFHYVEDAQQLPDLMLRETTRALTPLSPGTEEYFPQLVGEHQLLSGIAEARLPPLGGYGYARPKDGADVLLHVSRLERRDPLLAVWQYGLGRVAAFTASPTDDAARWVTWPEFSKFWSQVAHWTARDHTDDQYAIDAQRRDSVVEIAVRSFGPTADGATLSARLRLDDETTREIDLVPRQPRLFTASLLDLPAGRYPLDIVKRTPSGAVSQQRALVTVPSGEQDEQDEMLRASPNLALLTQLTEATGGTLDQPARALAERTPGTRRISYALDAVLLPLAMGLFLADVAVRQMRRRPRAAALFADGAQPTTMR